MKPVHLIKVADVRVGDVIIANLNHYIPATEHRIEKITHRGNFILFESRDEFGEMEIERDKIAEVILVERIGQIDYLPTIYPLTLELDVHLL